LTIILMTHQGFGAMTRALMGVSEGSRVVLALEGGCVTLFPQRVFVTFARGLVSTVHFGKLCAGMTREAWLIVLQRLSRP
jgi:hypothetical protein